MTPWRTSAAGGGVVAASAVAAWALAYPQNSLGDTAIRAIADVAAVVTLGLAVVPRFDEPRYRFEVASRAAGPLIASSAVWAVAELVRLVLAAAQAAGTTVVGLDVRTAIGVRGQHRGRPIRADVPGGRRGGGRGCHASPLGGHRRGGDGVRRAGVDRPQPRRSPVREHPSAGSRWPCTGSPRRCGAGRWPRWCSPSSGADSGPGYCLGSRPCRWRASSSCWCAEWRLRS